MSELGLWVPDAIVHATCGRVWLIIPASKVLRRGGRAVTGRVRAQTQPNFWSDTTFCAAIRRMLVRYASADLALTRDREVRARFDAEMRNGTIALVDLADYASRRTGADNRRSALLQRFLEDRPVGRERGDQARQRWMSAIAEFDLGTRRDGAALWSKTSAPTAKRLAAVDDRVTLEAVLEQRTGFFSRYADEFGQDNLPLTYEIWKALSLRYAAGLSGSVVAYINDPALRAALMTHAERRRADPQGTVELPLLTDELERISTLMLSNDRITSVEVRDVESGLSALLLPSMVRRSARWTR